MGVITFLMTSSAWHQVTKADLEPYLERVRDGALRHALEYGVAFLHETQAPAEQEVVNTLFSSGAIQVRCRTCTWESVQRLKFAAQMAARLLQPLGHRETVRQAPQCMKCVARHALVPPTPHQPGMPSHASDRAHRVP